MPILINDTSPRAQYTATSGQTAFSIPFEFFANSDLKVYKNAVLLTLTTDYTATGAGVTGGGTLTLVVGAATNDIITIVRDVPVSRTSDFPTSGPFNIEALNTDLDRLVAMSQQQEARDTRTLRLSDDDTPATLGALPLRASRVGRVLAFNETTGNPEAGPTIAAVGTVSGNTASINTVATNIASVNTVAGNTTNINTVAGVSSNVTTVAGNIANVNTVASDLNEPVSEINTVATSIANVDTVGGAISDVNAVAGQISPTNNIATVAGAATNIATVAGIASNVTTVAGISGNVTTVAGNSANVTTVAGSISNVNTAATNIASINTNATNIASINTNASNITAIQNASSNASAAASSASDAATSASNAAASASAAATSFDQFDDRYLGAKASDPSLDNDGNALLTGAIYFNTTTGNWRVWNGTSWDNGVTNVTGFMPTTGGTFTGGVTFTAPPVINVSASTDAFRITQTGTGNALLIEDETNPDSSPFQVNASGQVSIGTTTATGKLNIYDASIAQVFVSGDAATAINLTRYSNDVSQANVVQRKARGTLASPAAVNSGDGVGVFVFNAYGGTNFRQIGTFTAAVETYTSDTNISGYLSFSTNSGSTTVSEKMRIDAAGQVRVGAGSAGAPALSVLDDTNTGIFFPAADTVAISAAGTEDFRIGPAGQIGIGGANYGTSGQVLTSGGASAAPSWATPAAGGFSNMQVFTSSGSWTVPAGITKAKVTVIGGGGGGGGANANGYLVGGGGGGGGGAIELVTGLTPGASVTVTVGAGGTAANDTAGGAGGTSSFGAFCSATGGSGGGRRLSSNDTRNVGGATAAVGAAPGAGSGGDINVSGTVGFAIMTGLGSVTCVANLTFMNMSSGSGGDAPFGLGTGGTWQTGTGNGIAGTGFGGGGSGGSSRTAISSGAAGQGGCVIVEW